MKRGPFQLDSWLYNLLIVSVIPILTIVLGRILARRPPKKINSCYGYRTERSMKNRDTWEFANRYIGRIWWVAGWILLLFSGGAVLLMHGKNEAAVDGFGIFTVLMQAVAVLIPIASTEAALKKNFDENGVRKD